MKNKQEPLAPRDRRYYKASICASREEKSSRFARTQTRQSEYLRHPPDAEPLCRRSLAVREKVLGPEHPHVVASLKNYAILLQKIGRSSEAEEMLARVRAIREGA